MSNDIRNCSIFIPSDTVYNGKEQKQKVQVMDGTRSMLTEGTDYELSYIDETPAGATSDITDVGTVTVTVTGKGKYTGSNFVTYDITPAPLKVETETASKEYDGSPLTANEGSVTGLVNDEKAALVTTGSQTEPGKSDNTYTIKWAGQSDPDLTAKEQNYQITKESLGVLTVGKYESEITLTSPGKIAVKSDSGEAV